MDGSGLMKITDMQPPVSNLKDSVLQKAPQALLRAAENARLLAEQTGTKFVTRCSSVNISKQKSCQM